MSTRARVCLPQRARTNSSSTSLSKGQANAERRRLQDPQTLGGGPRQSDSRSLLKAHGVSITFHLERVTVSGSGWVQASELGKDRITQSREHGRKGQITSACVGAMRTAGTSERSDSDVPPSLPQHAYQRFTRMYWEMTAIRKPIEYGPSKTNVELDARPSMHVTILQGTMQPSTCVYARTANGPPKSAGLAPRTDRRFPARSNQKIGQILLLSSIWATIRQSYQGTHACRTHETRVSLSYTSKRPARTGRPILRTNRL